MSDPIISAIALKTAKKGFKGAVGTLDERIRSHPFKSATGHDSGSVPNLGLTGDAKLSSPKVEHILSKKNLVGGKC